MQAASNDGEGMEQNDPSFIAGGNVMGMATMKGTLEISYKPKHTLTGDPASASGIHPKRVVHTSTYTQMFIANLFSIYYVLEATTMSFIG